MSAKILSLPTTGATVPKLPKLPETFIIVRDRKAMQAEKDARIVVMRQQGRVVTDDEQKAREGAKRKIDAEARKASNPVKAQAAIVKAPKAEPEPKIVRAKVFTLTNDVRPMTGETGAKLLAALVSMLGEDSSVTRAVLAEGVCLAMWVKSVATDPISHVRDEQNVCIQRKWYATAQGAHDGGKAAMGEGKCTSYTVSNEIHRADVLAGARPVARDVKIPSRKRGAICKHQDFNRNPRWQKNHSTTRVTFSGC